MIRNIMIKLLSNKISFQQAKLTVMVAVLLGIVFSLGQLFIDLKDEKKRLDDTMQQVLSISRESAIQAATNLDKELAEQVAKGIFQFSPIYKAELVDNYGDILASMERKRPADNRWQWLVNFILEPSKSYTVELVNPDYNRMMGVMTVEVDIHSFTQNFFSRAIVVILSGLLRNFLLASILFILFHYILTRPLLSIISAFAGITPGDTNNMAIKTSHINRNDELGVLVRTINNVLIKFSETLERHRSAEQKVKKSEERFRRYFELGVVGMAVTSIERKFIQVNDRLCEMLGYSREELQLKSWPELTCADTPASDDEMFNRIVTGDMDSYVVDKCFTAKGGRTIHSIMSLRAMRNVDGTIDHFLLLIQDISRHKEAEDKIKLSLKEKEILLREVHHRVKNNMQIISSLLNLQSEHIEDNKYIDMLNDSQNRIRSMALVHEKLYRSEDLANINFNDYIRTLAQSLFAFYEKNSKVIVLNIDIEHIVLTVDTAIPCGLIINELLSNCLKHAFHDRKNGEINISFKKSSIDGEVWYTICVNDNGVGIPEGFDIRNSKTLGIQLIKTLVEHQLQGELKLQRKDGTTYNIRFKELDYIKRI